VVVYICCSTLYAQQQPADYVNPFIGTSNFGATYPGPIAARGMASISPFNVAGAQNLPLEKVVGCLLLMFMKTPI
jgi:hypothetical protein